MQYKKIMLFFWPALALCVILRTLQLVFTIEAGTGFFVPEFSHYGWYILAVIFLFGLVSAAFAFTAHRSPEAPPRINIFISAASLILAIIIPVELLTLPSGVAVPVWQEFLMRLAGIAAAVFFAAFGLSKFLDFKIPSPVFMAPAIYLVIRVVYEFSAMSSLAIISDNLVHMAAYCSALIFMLNFAKLYNRVDEEYNFRKLMASSILAVVFCFTQSVPQIAVRLITGTSYLHISFVANLSVFGLGVFIMVFMLSHFSRENACK